MRDTLSSDGIEIYNLRMDTVGMKTFKLVGELSALNGDDSIQVESEDLNLALQEFVSAHAAFSTAVVHVDGTTLTYELELAAPSWKAAAASGEEALITVMSDANLSVATGASIDMNRALQAATPVRYLENLGTKLTIA